MRPKSLFLLAVVCCALTVLASPSLAAGAEAQTENPIAALMAPGGCSALAIGTPEPLFMTCTIQVECADSSVVSCSGATCSTGGTGNQCVVCDGTTHGCCTTGTCCDMCDQQRTECFDNCPPELRCNWCNVTYNHCIANCTGGCP
jgi:hypothetical protein